MAGRRGTNLRGGDLSEELAILLLKSVAAVAPVPRPEDVGIDAVATLLRPEGKFLIAEDSFYVQFKSASEERVLYKEHEIRWARELKLPLFIGHVDKSASSIDLYSTHHLHEVFAEKIEHEQIC